MNDNFNTIIKYYSKKAKKISDDLLDLFKNLFLCGVQISGGEIHVLLFARYMNHQFNVLKKLKTVVIPVIPSNSDQAIQAGEMINLLYLITQITQRFVNQIHKIEKEIEMINSDKREEEEIEEGEILEEEEIEEEEILEEEILEESTNPGNFLLNNFISAPSSPKMK
ncbi:hypothetical protein C2G38_663899 [Gigaspora rosea]|uniref:Uncharacterized protein n=1 Tax=Gigaspora rosea TaxID=44941 RepID=A0A397U4V6_9GLOM|nr:hypothetical protein C2G38_663899 [Gigaspora rosea]